MPFSRVSIIGLGLIGSSLARAIRAHLPEARTTGYDASEEVRATARRIDLTDIIADTPADAVAQAELVVLCVPPGAMGVVAGEIAPHLPAGVILSEVASCQESVIAAIQAAAPGVTLVPAHPVAGTENSGPEAGFASLFKGRWCILTPPEGTDPAAIDRVDRLWHALGADVEMMDPAHHDLVLAVTSHLPHLIAYTIVGTATDLEEDLKGEVIKFSASGFRDFTRIAASDPVMWRDVFLANKDAVLEVLGRFTEDLAALQRAIRWGDGETLHAIFERARRVRREVIEAGQDSAAPNWGRDQGAEPDEDDKA